MIQMFLSVILLIVMAFFAIAALAFGILALLRRRNETQKIVFGILAFVFFMIVVVIWNVNTSLFEAESTDMEKNVGAFECNFGFAPPATINEINVKNFTLHDASVHWMAFTYDSLVLNKILVHDSPLDTVYRGTLRYIELCGQLTNGCTNCPDWLCLPDGSTTVIYYRKNFLKHAFSEYHLWAVPNKKMIYLEVSYFD